MANQGVTKISIKLRRRFFTVGVVGTAKVVPIIEWRSCKKLCSQITENGQSSFKILPTNGKNPLVCNTAIANRPGERRTILRKHQHKGNGLARAFHSKEPSTPFCVASIKNCKRRCKIHSNLGHDALIHHVTSKVHKSRWYIYMLAGAVAVFIRMKRNENHGEAYSYGI
nr:hypothetical protein L204_04990 [Cryptococcus depauperatus CBS 7855]